MHSWTSRIRPLCAGLALLGAAGVALAQDLGDATKNTAACCQLTTSLIQDVVRGKDVAGDERFFSSEGAPPNIHFLIDTSGSMRELPQVDLSQHDDFFDATLNGCENPALDAFQVSRGWDPTFVYPVPDPGTGLGSDTGFPNLFRDNKFYGYMFWGDSSNPGYQWHTKEQACQSQVPQWNGARAAEYNRCLTCLTNKGYYKLPEAEAANSGDLSNPNFIFWGRFLNFNPPKYVSARAALKQVIKDLRRVRAGISYFINSTPNTAMANKQNPSCSQILSDASAFDNNRASYINDINGLTFTTGTPLARSLLNVGYYFTSNDNVYKNDFGFGSSFNYPSAFKNSTLTSQNRSVCWGCQVNSVIIITDGEPSGDTLSSTIITKMRNLNGGPVYCPDSQPCPRAGVPNNQRDKGNNPTNPGDDNPSYYLDDVAMMLANQDLQRNSPTTVGDFNTAGKQSLNIYTVGFGINSNLLRNTAAVGNGEYYTADDGASLRQALLDIINSVQTRATSFSSAAASALQVRAAGATLIPRFTPARNKTAPWQGFLYRFNLGPERLLNCVPGGTGDLNADGDCDDTHLIDAEGDAIIENDEGNFVKLSDSLTPAVPFWEAGAKLKAPGQTTKWMTRKIYTIVDSNNDNKLDANDTPIEFNEANAALLQDYLGVSNNPNGCNDLAAKIGLTSLTPIECTKLIIRWYRGANALHIDPAERNYDRPFLLHDIFHSSPVTVDPPMPRAFCNFSFQCTVTLFAGRTPQDESTAPLDAYGFYQSRLGKRDKVVLVGSNGGMLHAFHNGHVTGEDPLTNLVEHDEGTGDELWAFVPPDLLPKLRPNIGKHGYFVDGTPMVREVWMDGVYCDFDDLGACSAADGVKQWQEFRTVAVMGSGRGGSHRFALDLTRLLGDEDTPPSQPNQAGDFLWMWPQPCDPIALQLGESFSNFSPRPPPIGPMALTPDADDALRVLAGETASTASSEPWSINGVDARERWVVALNGGNDQTQTRGRGMAIVDLKSGHTMWSFFHNDGQSRSQYLRYPIAAGISLLDIGSGSTAAGDSDMLLDSGTVGDYGGQLWMLRMWNPGEWDPGTQRITNWFAARAFRVKNPTTSPHPDNIRGPFTYMTVNTLQPDTGYLRTFVGTGDNQNLLDKGSVCRLSNPLACAAQGCQSNLSLSIERGGNTAWVSTVGYQNFHYNSGTSLPGAGGNACGGSRVTLNWTNSPANGCGNDNDGSIQYTCAGDSTTWNCGETTNTWTELKFEKTNRPYPRRFYGLWTYGVFPSRQFNTDAEADAYDAALFTDDDLINVGQFDSSGGVIAASQQEAPAAGKGWYIEYANNDERTGNTGTLVAGCMLWNSFEPSGAAGVVCSTTGTNKARLYQSNYATGRANCAAGFYSSGTDSWKRYIESTTIASAPEPTAQLSLGGGLLSRVVTLIGPGLGDGGGGGGAAGGVMSTEVATTDEGVKSLYQIVLDRRGHNCRHEGINCD